MYEQAHEETKIRIEKTLGEDLLKNYFSDGAFRLLSDVEEQPRISHRITRGTEPTIPDAHTAFHLVERSTLPNDTSRGGWKIHTLYMYVHAGPPFTMDALVRVLEDVVKEKDEGGELLNHRAFGILQLGMKIAFLEKAKSGLVPYSGGP